METGVENKCQENKILRTASYKVAFQQTVHIQTVRVCKSFVNELDQLFYEHSTFSFFR